MQELWIVLVGMGLLLGGPVAAEAQDQTYWMEGTWNGSAHQNRTNSDWTIHLVVTRQSNDSHSYWVSYPSLSCGGYWTLNQAGNHVASFTEHITTGRKRCVDGGTISVGDWGETDNLRSRMRFHWTGPGDLAAGTLIRE
jgi:eukaryotic-like serine/threonine-protein kinase